MNPAIYFHPEAYTTSGPRLMGRHAAGESFLRGYFAYSKATQLWAQVHQMEHAPLFEQAARDAGRAEPVHVVDNRGLARLRDAGVVYYPGPGLAEHAWRRSFYGDDAWSLCGITHTTSSAAAMDSIAGLIGGPIHPWDALICTSSAVKDNVMAVLRSQSEYFAQRFGATRFTLPQLPVIPLGVHGTDFQFTVEDRARARQKIGVDAETMVVLFLGRLSFHAKAHPLAMYQALERAAAESGKQVVLVECGWHGNAPIADAYAAAAALGCPSVRIVTLDGKDPAERQHAWAGADVFCSLVDNIQETFGIAPVEAMAAGLPVVVSDWDGYKDTVLDGVTGFRIPTLMPESGMGRDLAVRHALEIDTYDRYCGYACSFVAVDVAATARAFAELFRSADLRARMGQAGRERVKKFFDWAVVMPQYDALWAELDAIRRKSAAGKRQAANPWPARMDPFQAFVTYPTRTFGADTLVRLVDADSQLAINRALSLRALAMVNFADDALPSPQEVEAVLRAASPQAARAGDLLAAVPQRRQPAVLRGIAWLVKLNLLEALAPPQHSVKQEPGANGAL